MYLFGLSLLFVSNILLLSGEIEISKDDGHLHWHEYKTTHGLEFNEEEDKERKSIFLDNLNFINKKNSENGPYTLKMNHMGHLRDDEMPLCYRKFHARNVHPKGENSAYQNDVSEIPKTYDWRSYGSVTKVKDQGKCGSCYSFSATGALESHRHIKTGHLIELSEQEILDCSEDYGNMACNGGLMDNVFRYAIEKGISSETAYPYHANRGKCNSEKTEREFKLKSYIDIDSGDETHLTHALATKGPVSIGIDASLKSFRFYSHGTYYDEQCSSQDLDHGVLAVGYGFDTDEYYIVKNSWGPHWGMNGYIHIARNRNNTCGVATGASYPVF